MCNSEIFTKRQIAEYVAIGYDDNCEFMINKIIKWNDELLIKAFANVGMKLVRLSNDRYYFNYN